MKKFLLILAAAGSLSALVGCADQPPATATTTTTETYRSTSDNK